ncbi:hypothetical protein [Salipiger mucosus]|uniref:Uncharacterized protein n=1 Tax=Salipiger mucosus DSM 16094 TaxID=1123237 RepID=S9Q8E7_9RHOB|nr:hypothetical protein [Salipiger mucosus]EPX75903.1 hypothetical protein Salmuc_01006 [Salipiger mucosus DSM 16094]
MPDRFSVYGAAPDGAFALEMRASRADIPDFAVVRPRRTRA